MKKKKTEKTNSASELFFWAQALCVSLAVLVCCNTFFFRLSGVVGSSMCDTLYEGDQLVLQVLGYDEPQRGDIVVCFSENYNDGKALVKRVIAVEGDTVDISDDGYMVVNGEELYEPYAREAIWDSNRGDQEYPLTVEEGKAFVVGDNRNHSSDSRMVVIGQIADECIIGKALFRIWPLNKIGSVS